MTKVHVVFQSFCSDLCNNMVVTHISPPPHSLPTHTGSQHDFPPYEDVHTVASLLKLYLRELPEPVVPFVFYDSFRNAAKCELTLHLAQLTYYLSNLRTSTYVNL